MNNSLIVVKRKTLVGIKLLEVGDYLEAIVKVHPRSEKGLPGIRGAVMFCLSLAFTILSCWFSVWFSLGFLCSGFIEALGLLVYSFH